LQGIGYAGLATSLFFQSSSSDILNAQSQLAALTAELSRLRSDDSYAAAFATAEALAQQLDIDCALPMNVSASYNDASTTTRQVQLPLCRRLTSSNSVSISQSLIDCCLS